MQLTPAMQQYQEMKKQYLDCVLFFRIGDFYETFFEDAHICHKVLDLVLTSKNKDAEHPIPMAGIPHHSIDKYIPKLIQHGYKVAIAEQTTDPIPWKLVQREISQIITPGTYIQEGSKKFNYMLAVTQQETKSWANYHLAWGDFTIGEYWTKSFSDLGDLQKWILTLGPTEIIIDIDFREKDSLSTPLQQYLKCLISVYEIPSDVELFLTNVCKVQSLSSFWQAVTEGRAQAIALLLNYIKHIQQHALTQVYKISYHTQLGMVLMDDITIKNLELFSSSYEANEKYSLVGILDQTVTTAGARYLRYLLTNPLHTLPILQERQRHIARYQHYPHTKMLLKQLNETFDMHKLLSIILYRKLNPTPFIKLRTTLGVFFDDATLFHSASWQSKQRESNDIAGEDGNIMKQELLHLGMQTPELHQLSSLYQGLQKALKADEEIKLDMDYIQDWYNEEIDRLRRIAYHSDELLLEYQQFLVRTTGVHNVKLKFVMNQGYFIEVTTKDMPAFEKSISEHLETEKGRAAQHNHHQIETPNNIPKLSVVRRQTLKDNQRYSSPYLEEIQQSILSSKDELVQLERSLLGLLAQEVSKVAEMLSRFAQKIAELDVYCSHALFALEHRYIQPELNATSSIVIEGGRHPVIEAYLPRDQQFIPNDLILGNQSSPNGVLEQDNGLIHIITGPNMGGKSTYLRQSALIVLLAHCGLFVPASKAKIGLIDGLFARVGSGDVIAKNQSTFMTEMIEVSNILNNATKKSFIIFDELGRGTSTYDGMALTSAILQYILKQVKANTLLATHYHELIALEEKYSEVRNFSVSVYETDKEVLFMKKIIKGWANKSYGIDVAKIAGIPESILQQAKEILKKLEDERKKGKSNSISNFPLFDSYSFDREEEAKWKGAYEKVQRMVSQVNVNTMTPLQALQFLAKVKEEMT